MPEKGLLASFTAYFENSKRNLSFDVQDGVAYIRLVAPGTEIADVAKLLLLAGQKKVFKVKIYEEKNDKKGQNGKTRRRKTIQEKLDRFKAT